MWHVAQSCGEPVPTPHQVLGRPSNCASTQQPLQLGGTPALGFLSDQLARERLRDFKLRSPEDYADSMTSRALFTKEWSAMPGM
jgi:hypothetical protein